MGHLFALLGAVAALIAILGPILSFVARTPHRRRVRRFRRRILREKQLLSKGKSDPSIIKQRLSDLQKEISKAFAMGKITKEEYDALNELAKI
jgi:hypothetical protein